MQNIVLLRINQLVLSLVYGALRLQHLLVSQVFTQKIHSS